MSDNPFPVFPVGSVGYNLMLARGTWHDHVEIYNLDGTPMDDDSKAGSGTPGPAPYDNIVYIDFDGETMTQTNVSFRGRDPMAKTFGGKLVNGILEFDELGPGAYKNHGFAAGPGILFYNSLRLEVDAWQAYVEPDIITYYAPGKRTRTTLLYRDGIATRTCTAWGSRISPTCDSRVDIDPRGTDGPVHEEPFVATVWEHLVK